jgi:hypothetical protein
VNIEDTTYMAQKRHETCILVIWRSFLLQSTVLCNRLYVFVET